MINALQYGPLSVALDGESVYFQHYHSGVFEEADECGTTLNHAVNVVGYNMDNDPPYFIVRNSWGEDWGEGGYMRLEITDGAGVCGVNQEVTFPGAYFIDTGYLALILLLVLLGVFGPLIGICCLRKARKDQRRLNEGA